MRRRRREEADNLNLSFLDAISCGFGAVILLLVITMLFEPDSIQTTREELGEEAPVQGVVLQPSQGVGLLQGVVGLLQPLLPVEGVDLGEEEPGLLGLPLPAEEGLPGEEVNGGVVVPLVQGLEDPLHRR